MLFTIVTVTFNSEKTLKKTIESILLQETSNFEYIIIDGESADNTVGIIKLYEPEFKKRQIPFTWLSEKDTGIYDAFNKGINLAKGTYISFLGSDDMYVPNALSLYTDQIVKHAVDVDFVHSVVKVDNRKIISDRWEWKHFRKAMNVAHVGAFHHKDYFSKYGNYNTNYKIAGDYELLLRAKKHLKTHWFNEVTAIMADGGVSNRQIKNVYIETTKAKINSGKMNYVIAKLQYFKWMFKYNVKKIVHAVIR